MLFRSVPAVRARELAASGQQDDYIRGLEAIYGITVNKSAQQPLSALPPNPSTAPGTDEQDAGRSQSA